MIPHGFGPSLTWLMTYALHSTLLLGTAWVLTRWMKPHHDRLSEGIWKTAVVGALLTATLQVILDVQPVSGRVHVATALAAPVQSVGIPGPIELSSNNHLVDRIDRSHEASPAHENRPPNSLPLPPNPILLLLTLGLTFLAVSRWRLKRQLSDRKTIDDDGIRKTLEEIIHLLGSKKKIRLTQSGSLRSPVAFGTFRPEICLPSRALLELSGDELRAVLSHEAAHLEARDPLWIQICHVLKVTFFFQPLNRLATRRISELAEYRCDAWTVTQTGQAIAYADCLTRIATWIIPGRNADYGSTASLAAPRSGLARRVTRLLDETFPRRHPQRRNAYPSGIALFFLLGFGFIAPTLTAEPEPLSMSGRDETERDGNDSFSGIGSSATGADQSLGNAIDSLNDEAALLAHQVAALKEDLIRTPDSTVGPLVTVLDRRFEQIERKKRALTHRIQTLLRDRPERAESQR